jgi:microcin-processing peptidase 2. Unknown type peptidase. MEROPS family U62
MLHLDLPQQASGVEALDVARQSILLPSGLDEDRIANVLGSVMGYSVDYADLYFALTREESWSLEDGIVKDGSHSIEQGVGVRALSGEKTGFAYSDEIVLPALTEASNAARAIARSGGNTSLQAWRASTGHRLYLPIDPLEGLSDADKVKLLERIDIEARRIDPRVTQVMASLSGSHEVVLVMASDGTIGADVRPLVRMNVSVIVEHTAGASRGTAAAAGDTGSRSSSRTIAGKSWWPRRCAARSSISTRKPRQPAR